MTDLQAYSVIGFDLDNTLFDQTEYEFAIFKKIAQKVEALYALDENTYFNALKKLYNIGEKEHTFDKALQLCLPDLPENWEEVMVSTVLELYRNYVPTTLTPFLDVVPILNSLKEGNSRLVLITNGRVKTQNSKIDKLGIRDYFDLILISDSYSPSRRKPDVTMFQDALEYFNIPAHSMIYIGDDLLRDKASEKIGVDFIHIDKLIYEK